MCADNELMASVKRMARGFEVSPDTLANDIVRAVQPGGNFLAEEHTVAFWFKTAAKNVRLCEAKRYSCYNNLWSDHVVSLNQGKVRFQLQGDQALETPGAFNDGQWHHVVTTVGPGGQRLHVDGKFIATGKLAKRIKTSNRLGLDLGPGGDDGLVTSDELKVLGRSLTSVEITRLAKQKRYIALPQLAARSQWLFRGGSEGLRISAHCPASGVRSHRSNGLSRWPPGCRRRVADCSRHSRPPASPGRGRSRGALGDFRLSNPRRLPLRDQAGCVFARSNPAVASHHCLATALVAGPSQRRPLATAAGATGGVTVSEIL